MITKGEYSLESWHKDIYMVKMNEKDESVFDIIVKEGDI